jgi:hypothetical protein
MFRGAELIRLLTGIVMLAVLFLFISNQHNAGRASVATKPSAVSQESSQKTPKPLPPATGPTDEDPKEASAARYEYQALTDGTMTLGPEEMEAYDRLVRWVNSQSFARLDRRAKKGLRYTDLYDDAEKHRGELIAFDLEVRAAGDAGKTRDGIPVHDAWAATDESRSRLYSLIVVDYPPQMPTGYNIRAKARFAGYLLKLQGYQPGSAKPGQAPEKAPLLIGRLQREPSATMLPPTDGWQEWMWVIGLLVILGLVWGFRWIYFTWIRRPPVSRSYIREAAPGEVIPIEQWLDQSGFKDSADSDHLDS